MLLRLILLAAIFWLIYLVFRSYARSIGREPRRENGEDMVRCAYCGVHLPKSESIESEGKFFCSDEHRRLDRK